MRGSLIVPSVVASLAAFALITGFGCGSRASRDDDHDDEDAVDLVSPKFYVSAYYASLKHAEIPASDIPFALFTHLHYFNALPTAAGSLSGGFDGDVIRRAHAAGRRVLLTVGGSASQVPFEQAMAEAQRASFVANILSAVRANGFDGIDLDMEPIAPQDAADFAAFVTDLRAALPPTMLLTSTLRWEVDLFATLQDRFDRLSLLSYHLQSDTTVAWHNAALYSPTFRQESTGEPLPSCDGLVTQALSAGIAPGKLSLGIDFNGELWSGASAPAEAGKGFHVGALTYAQIEDSYASAGSYRWDPAAHVPYLSLGDAGSPNLISYDDPRSVADKVSYAVARGLGGVMLWNLAADYRPSQPEGARSALAASVDTEVQALVQAWGTDAAVAPFDASSQDP